MMTFLSFNSSLTCLVYYDSAGSRPGDKGGGRSSRPLDNGGGGLQIFFFGPSGPKFSLKIKKGGLRHCYDDFSVF